MWVQLRQHEFTLRLGNDDTDPVTVGVLLTPRHDGRRPWDTTMCAVTGRLELTDEDIAACVALWRNEHDVIAA